MRELTGQNTKATEDASSIADRLLKVKSGLQRRIAKAMDRLLALPDVPAPDDYQEWEKEYLKGKYSCP